MTTTAPLLVVHARVPGKKKMMTVRSRGSLHATGSLIPRAMQTVNVENKVRIDILISSLDFPLSLSAKLTSST